LQPITPHPTYDLRSKHTATTATVFPIPQQPRGHLRQMVSILSHHRDAQYRHRRAPVVRTGGVATERHFLVALAVTTVSVQHSRRDLSATAEVYPTTRLGTSVYTATG